MNVKLLYPIRVIATYKNKPSPAETGYSTLEGAFEQANRVIDYKEVSKLLTITIMKGDEEVWHKSFGT